MFSRYDKVLRRPVELAVKSGQPIPAKIDGCPLWSDFVAEVFPISLSRPRWRTPESEGSNAVRRLAKSGVKSTVLIRPR
jgi:hypothetical protein